MAIKKGKKRVRNVPVHYDEVKKKHSIFLTPTSWEKATVIATKKKISVSIFIEELIRNHGT